MSGEVNDPILSERARSGEVLDLSLGGTGPVAQIARPAEATGPTPLALTASSRVARV